MAQLSWFCHKLPDTCNTICHYHIKEDLGSQMHLLRVGDVAYYKSFRVFFTLQSHTQNRLELFIYLALCHRFDIWDYCMEDQLTSDVLSGTKSGNVQKEVQDNILELWRGQELRNRWPACISFLIMDQNQDEVKRPKKKKTTNKHECSSSRFSAPWLLLTIAVWG